MVSGFLKLFSGFHLGVRPGVLLAFLLVFVELSADAFEVCRNFLWGDVACEVADDFEGFMHCCDVSESENLLEYLCM